MQLKNIINSIIHISCNFLPRTETEISLFKYKSKLRIFYSIYNMSYLALKVHKFIDLCIQEICQTIN